MNLTYFVIHRAEALERSTEKIGAHASKKKDVMTKAYNTIVLVLVAGCDSVTASSIPAPTKYYCRDQGLHVNADQPRARNRECFLSLQACGESAYGNKISCHIQTYVSCAQFSSVLDSETYVSCWASDVECNIFCKAREESVLGPCLSPCIANTKTLTPTR